MEFNFVPLLEAAKGLTWQGVVVILACLFTICYLSRNRLIHGDKERTFWREATPEQLLARAATTATLPRPTPAPPSPLAPLVVLLIFIGCALLPPPLPSISILRGRHIHPMGDYHADTRPPGVAIQEIAN